MEFSYSRTENFEMEKLSSDTGYFKKPVEIKRGLEAQGIFCLSLQVSGFYGHKKYNDFKSTCFALKIVHQGRRNAFLPDQTYNY